MDLKKLADFFFESRMLNKVKRSGDLLAGNPFPDSIANHTFTAMTIGYILAKLEKADENKVLKMLLFHSLPETRITNLHRVAYRYIDIKKAKKLAFKEQLSYFPEETKKELTEVENERIEMKTKEAKVSKDADCLSDTIAAKEAIEKGIDMEVWIKHDEMALQTESGKKLMEELKKTNSKEWWKNLKYIPNIKVGSKKF